MVRQKLYIVSGRNSNGKVVSVTLISNSTVLQVNNIVANTHIEILGKNNNTGSECHTYKINTHTGVE